VAGLRRNYAFIFYWAPERLGIFEFIRCQYTSTMQFFSYEFVSVSKINYLKNSRPILDITDMDK